ncbi:MAG TPA: cytochrome c, partial [Gemmatimonadaceae bacterium]|nr:cytochrome c [Gemmatimonadaceae bacterium]
MAPQEPVGKRLAAIVGVAIEEYGKGVDEAGRLKSATELDEATGFLDEAGSVAARLATPAAPAVRRLLDSLRLAARSHRAPSDLHRLYESFARALGAEGALDLPSRAINLARGRTIYATRCAACHGAAGDGGPAAPGGVAPPAIGHADVMRDATPTLTYRIVSVGVQGTAMPAWDTVLTTDERWDVVGYVNALRATDAQRARGREVLARICGTCAPPPAARTFEWQAR